MKLHVLVLVLFFNVSFASNGHPELPNNLLTSKALLDLEKNVSVLTHNTTEFILLSSEDALDDCDYSELLVTIPYSQEVEIILVVDVSAIDSWALSSVKNSSNQEIVRLLKSSGSSHDGSSRYFRTHHLRYLTAGTYKLYVDLCEAGLYEGVHYAQSIIRYNK